MSVIIKNKSQYTKSLESIERSIDSLIKSQDRVNISLEQYEKMKADLQKQQLRIDHLINQLDKSRKFIEKSGIPWDVIDLLDRDNIDILHCDDDMFMRKYRIEFEIPIEKLRSNGLLK